MNARTYSLDVLKIVATILIIFHHYQQSTGVIFDGINFYNGTFYFGYVVELFFIMSGYFMYGYIEKIKNGQAFKKFILRRVTRLLPLVTVSVIAFDTFLVIYNVVSGHLYRDTVDVDIWGSIITCLGIQDGWGLSNPGVNNPTWYISVLIICYIVFYFVTWLSKRWCVNEIYFYIGLIFVGMSILTYEIALPFFSWDVGRGYYAFYGGVLLAYLVKRGDIQAHKRIYIMSFISIITIMLCLIYLPQWVSNEINYIMAFVFYPALIILFDSPFVRNVFKHKIWGVLSKASYNAFVWHGPLFILIDIMVELFSWKIDFNAKGRCI